MKDIFRAIPDWGRWLIALIVFLLAAGAFAVFAFAPMHAPKTAKVGLVLPGGTDEPGPSLLHYQGMKEACGEFGAELITAEHVRPEDCPGAVEDLIEKGAGMIFLCGNRQPAAARKVIAQHPRVAFAAFYDGADAPNMTTCFVRMYQGRYLAGALAGLHSKSGVIGYVAAMEHPGVNRGINAFTLGVRRTNPNAKVVVAWTYDWSDSEKAMEQARRLIQESGADVLTHHQDNDAICSAAAELGKDYIGYQVRNSDPTEHSLGTVSCRWDIYYRNILKHYLKGDLNLIRKRGFGIEEGVVWLSDIPDRIGLPSGYSVIQLRRELDDGRPIFRGPIRDSEGGLRIGSGEVLRDDVLMNRMDWFVEGVDFLGK